MGNCYGVPESNCYGVPESTLNEKKVIREEPCQYQDNTPFFGDPLRRIKSTTEWR